MKLTEQQKRLMNDGDPEPDIVREAQAVMFFFLAVLCALLVAALVIGVGYGIYALVERFILPLC